jgi:peptidoglycan/xylan/chitin deacetylase (PgdA/CDA1 family)
MSNTLRRFPERVRNYCRRTGATYLFKRPIEIRTDVPIISFTFDDFPRSALLEGGAILQRYGLVGTYYASLGMIGRDECCGRIFLREDLETVIKQGHELGCHTFGHLNAGQTPWKIFEKSVVQNSLELDRLCPQRTFRTLSYPIAGPRLWIKHKMAGRFEGCRGGGQTYNSGTADLNYLCAYFLEKARGDIQAVKDLIRRNQSARGWLIFATHNIDSSNGPFGCTPEFFESVVSYCVSSGARIVPVAAALDLLQIRGES